jgi:hypothetical protein
MRARALHALLLPTMLHRARGPRAARTTSIASHRLTPPSTSAHATMLTERPSPSMPSTRTARLCTRRPPAHTTRHAAHERLILGTKRRHCL